MNKQDSLSLNFNKERLNLIETVTSNKYNWMNPPLNSRRDLLL